MTNINSFNFRNGRLRDYRYDAVFDRARRLIEFRNGGDRHPPCLLVLVNEQSEITLEQKLNSSGRVSTK